MQAHPVRVTITLLLVVGLLLAGARWRQPVVLADEPPLTDLPVASATTSQLPTNLLCTTWGAPQYALADDGPALWIGATGGVVRWDKTQGTYRRYTAVDRLPHSVVLAAAVDGAGNRGRL